MEENREKLQKEAIQKISPELHTYQNSINLLVGKQGMGKTFTALREIIKITLIDRNVHLVMIVNKDGEPNDVTYNLLQHMFQAPIVFVSYDAAEESVKRLLMYKNLYNTILEQHLEHRIDPTQLVEIDEVLHVSDFQRPFLNTIIYFEDCANSKLFRKPIYYFPQLIATCRHNGLTMFFTAQFWKGITTELKANATTIYIFRDYSPQQLQYILQQTPVKYELAKIYKLYRQLRNHDRLVVDTVRGVVTIDKS